MLGALDCGEEGALDCGDAGAGAGASESESDVDVVEEDEDVDVSDEAFSAFPSVFCFFGAGRCGCSASLSLMARRPAGAGAPLFFVLSKARSLCVAPSVHSPAN